VRLCRYVVPKAVAGGPAAPYGDRMAADLFDATAMYDEDYLHFFAAPEPAGGPGSEPGNEPGNEPGSGPGGGPTHGPVVGTAYSSTAHTTDLAWRLLDLEPEMTVLDLACGHGALANALAARGCRVTGLDSSAVFLDRARADAVATGVPAEYVPGDMRQLPAWTGRFDRLVCWTSAFGYFDDPTNRTVLAEMVRVLRPGGRLAMDVDNLTRFLAVSTPSRITATLANGDMLVDRHHLDPLTARFEVERTVIRDGRARRLTFVKRLFGFPELRDWCTAAGLADVAAYGEDGRPLTAEHHRMIVVARRP
jgi:SAM-dependent methyltransferase